MLYKSLSRRNAESQGHVGTRVPQRIKHAPGADNGNMHPNARVLFLEAADVLGQEVRHHALHAYNAHVPRRCAREIPDAFSNGVEIFFDTLGVSEYESASFGENHAARPPVEQGDSELGFQLRDLATYGARGDREPLRGPPERAGTSGFAEIINGVG